MIPEGVPPVKVSRQGRGTRSHLTNLCKRATGHCSRCVAVDRDVGGPELRVDVAEKPSQADGVDDEVDPSVCDFRRQRDASEDEVLG